MATSEGPTGVESGSAMLLMRALAEEVGPPDPAARAAWPMMVGPEGRVPI